MTDREIESRLRAFYLNEVGEGETAPVALRRDVAAIPRTIPQRARWFGRSRGLTLLAAAALLLVGGAVAAGSGLVRLPSLVPPVPAPTAPVAVASPTVGPTILPSPTETPSSVEPRAASWTPTGDMVAGRWGGTAVLLQGGKVLVVGGAGPNAELYDPATGTWAATGGMITPCWYCTATRLLDGRVLVAGGADDAGAPLASAELYDPASGTWAATGGMITPNWHFTATLLPDGKILVAGGSSKNAPVASAELYDPRTGSWTPTGSMSTKREGATATLLADGRVLVAGGLPGTVTGVQQVLLASAELYDPGTGAWTPTGDMTEVRASARAALLGDGRVLVVGGTGDRSKASAELYDPSTGSWTATAPLSTREFGFSVTVLRDGRVLVAGGVPRIVAVGNSSAVVCDPGSGAARLYDPRTGTWTATSNMIQGRYGHTATLLPDGNVLVAGGAISITGSPCRPGPDDLLSSAELYDPGTGQ